jgi:hypothetical protein
MTIADEIFKYNYKYEAPNPPVKKNERRKIKKKEKDDTGQKMI